MFLLTVPPLITVFHTDGVIMGIKGRTIRKVTGVGLGKVQKKKISCKGKLSEKKFMHNK